MSKEKDVPSVSQNGGKELIERSGGREEDDEGQQVEARRIFGKQEETRTKRQGTAVGREIRGASWNFSCRNAVCFILSLLIALIAMAAAGLRSYVNCTFHGGFVTSLTIQNKTVSKKMPDNVRTFCGPVKFCLNNF